LLILYEGAITAAAERAKTPTRVRSYQPVIAAAIGVATEQSATFRSMVLIAVGLVPAVAGTQERQSTASASDYPRVRSGSGRLSALIADATEESPTFKALVTAIAATDGIVLVEEGTCRPGVLACLAWRVTLAGRYRILHVMVEAGRPDIELIASIGHELRHALEVLEDPSLRSAGAIRLFYMRGKPESPRAVETHAAQSAGDAIYREIRRSRGEKR
jgi:hypothetical protein